MTFSKAPPRYKLIMEDYSRQEARIISGLSKDPKVIGLLKAGSDIYLEMAKGFVGGDGKGLHPLPEDRRN